MRLSETAAGPLEASIFVEALRAQPGAFLGLALSLYVLLWTIALTIAQPSPHPELAINLALGREWQLGYAGAPPLPVWIAEAIYYVTGSILVLKFAAALCVALAGWFIFLFACRIVGDRQGAIAVLLMAGVTPVAFPLASLNADVIQMPLAALAILFWWFAVGERRINAWPPLAIVLGAMFYAGPHPIILIVVFAAVTALAPRGRASLGRFDAMLSFVFSIFVFVFIITPRVLLLARNGFQNIFAAAESGIDPRGLSGPLEFPFSLIAGHFGLAILVFLATAYAVRAKENAPVFLRPAESLFARRAAIVVALAPAALALALVVALAQPARTAAAASLIMLTGLLVVLLTGERLIVRRQRVVAITAAALLVLPPAMEIAFSFALPWFGEAARTTNWPAASAARSLTEIYRTRTGRPLEYIAGERTRAAQIAISSRDRSHVIADADLAKSAWIDAAHFKERGGIVFWEISGANVDPPGELILRLPAFVAEAPLRLPWVRGGADPVRLGWAIVPPAQ